MKKYLYFIMAAMLATIVFAAGLGSGAIRLGDHVTISKQITPSQAVIDYANQKGVSVEDAIVQSGEDSINARQNVIDYKEALKNYAIENARIINSKNTDLINRATDALRGVE